MHPQASESSGSMKAMGTKVLVSLVVSLISLAGCAIAVRADDGPPVAPQRPQLSGGSQSTTLQSGTQSTTLQSSTQSTMLQTGTAGALIQGGAGSSLIQGGVNEEAGPVNILFVVDASQSMKEKIGGATQKIDAAKRVLEESMQRIPGDVNVGLRVFGQGYSGFPLADCTNSALMVPLGQGNRRSIIDQVRQIKPFGLTPLTFALQQAAEDDFRDVQGRKVLILITDGEDTCGQNPCAYIASLPRHGIKLKVDVVGVDLAKEKHAREALNCIAQVSGGKYYDANTAGQLIDSVAQSVDTAISGRVMITPSAPAKNTETPPELHPMQPMQQLHLPPQPPQ